MLSFGLIFTSGFQSKWELSTEQQNIVGDDTPRFRGKRNHRNISHRSKKEGIPTSC